MSSKMPQNILAEQNVLSCIINEPGFVNSSADQLEVRDFYEVSHQLIYDTIIKLYEKGESINIISIATNLSNNNNLVKVGGLDYLNELNDMMPAVDYFEDFLTLVKDAATKRSVINLAAKIAKDGYDNDLSASDYIDLAQEDIFKLSEQRRTSGFRSVTEITEEYLTKTEQNRQNKRQILGIASGYSNLDRITYGFKEEEFIILAARPSVGKSAFAINLALNIAKRNPNGKDTSVAIFSLEMSNDQIVSRMIAKLSGINSYKLITGSLKPDEWSRVNTASEELKRMPIYFDDSAASTVQDVRAKCRKLKQEDKLDFVIIDYLQLLDSSEKTTNRQEAVSKVSRGLKLMAKELKVPVLALSQLSRSVETKSGDEKKPMLFHLRESGAIEQDADIVLLMHRPDLYDKEKRETDDDENPVSRIEINVAKNRQGLSGSDLLFRFRLSTSDFNQIDKDREE